MKKHLFMPLACLFVTMIGFGITLPALPYVERYEHFTWSESSARSDGRNERTGKITQA